MMGLESSSLPENILKRISAKDRAPLGKAGRTAAECQEVQVAKSEKELQGQLEALLRRRGYIPARQRMDKRSNLQEGMPDFFFAVNGVAVYWEVKLHGTTTKKQEDMLWKLSKLPMQAYATLIFSYQQALDSLHYLETKCHAVRP